MRSKLRIKSFVWILCMILGCCIWIRTGIESYAAATAEVVTGEGRIRESADKSSKTLASVKKGDKLDVLSETKDGEGYTWYKVRIDAEDNGYIRADLVTVNGTVPTEKVSSSDSNQTSASTESQSSAQNQAQETVVAVTVSETDVVSVKTVTQARVRKGAGTNFESAGGIKEGITIPVSGVAIGSDGKNWYQVSHSENNNTISGFIREDLVEVVERMEIPEEVVEEAQPIEEVAPPIENQDYYLKYLDNESGEADWYLFNNIEGTSMSLTQMLSVIDQVKNKELKEADQVATMKIIIFAMAAALVILVVIVTVLAFKLRDSYIYEEYEDEEEEEEEIRPIPEPKRVISAKPKKEEEPIVPPVRESLKRPSGKREREELPPVKVTKSENRSWQSKDFLELDDDMEFEFLDL